MNLTQAFKVFELNILRQAGIAVTPQQIGLKSDPIADLQAKNSQTSFNNILSRMSGLPLGNMTAPTPPTPPSDASDAAAQAQYQKDLLTYQQNSQLYNQRLMQMMLQQLQNIQQTMAANQSQQKNNSSGNNSSDASSSSAAEALGIGGILF